MFNKKIKAVIFDLDGVLTDTAGLHFQAWKRMLKEKGAVLPDEFCNRLRGVGRDYSLRLIAEHFHLDLDQATQEKMTETKNNFYQQMIQQVGRERLLPGAIERLEELKYLNVKVALASSSRNAPQLIEQLAIKNYFQVIIKAETISEYKPHPEIFLRAAKQLQLLPCACIGVEDATAGIEAINRAHMWSMGIGPKPNLFQADWIFLI